MRSNATPGTKVIAASYERVSTTSQARYGFSLAAQRQSMAEFAESQGWDLPAHLQFQDTGSGADWDLPGLNAMLQAARAGEFSVLIVPDFDRLARSMVKALVLEEQLKKYGVEVVYQRVPVEDSPEGRLLRNQLHGFAEYDREKRRLASMMGKLRKAQEGMVVGGPRPKYGYRFVQAETRGGNLRTVGLELDPLTAPVVKRIFELARNHSNAEIAAMLNAEGVPAPGGGRWVNKTVWRILSNPVYCGTWVYGRSRRYDARLHPDETDGVAVEIEAIVDRGTWERVQEAMAARTKRRRARRPKEEDPYELRGLLACGHCGNTLYCRDNSGVRYYHCGHSAPARARAMGWEVCDLPDAHAVSLERELWELLTATLLDPEYLRQGLAAAGRQHAESEQLRVDRMQAIDREIAKHRRELQAFVSRLPALGDGELYDLALKQARDIEARITSLRREREALEAAPGGGLSPDAIEEVEAFAAMMAAGLDLATPVERRELYELLNVRGRVYADKHGVKLGRKHRFRLEWTAAIPLRHNAASTLTTVTVCRSGDGRATLSILVGGTEAAG